MYKQYNSIICISDKAKENLQEYIGSNYPIKTIYNGIDIQKFMHATPLNRDSLILKDNFIICMVAGFRPQKDQDTLIQAMKRLPNNFHLWLIGDGERRKELEILTQKEELTNRVKFWGIRSDIPQLLKTADIIVMSSHWEGLSLSSLEGMSSGKPFIASDVDGLHEVVNGYGILFPEGNDKALSKIVLQLVQDKSLYKNIAEKCQKRAEEYDLQKTINSYLSIYQNTVS
jgi:glycosyltransferase involved in cell wall biosynthesis